MSWRAMAGWLVVALLAACAGNSPAPEHRYYRLPAVQPDVVLPKPLERRLAVARVRGRGVYSERPIVYVDSDQPLVLRAYHYHLWAVPPGELLQDALVGYLRRAKAASSVQRASGRGDGGMVTGRIERLERVVGPQGARVSVVLELGYRRAGHGTDGGWSRLYEAGARAVDETMPATVEAFGQALGRVYDGFLHDLGKGGPAAEDPG